MGMPWLFCNRLIKPKTTENREHLFEITVCFLKLSARGNILQRHTASSLDLQRACCWIRGVLTPSWSPPLYGPQHEARLGRLGAVQELATVKFRRVTLD